MTVSFAHVNAFTGRAFAGNPAGVCIGDASLDAPRAQRVAREMNLPATAFLHERDGVYHLRWFTVTRELELCGHGTLASAHVLYETGRVAPGVPIRFDTRGGRLTATRRDGWIALDFPATPPEDTQPPAGLLEALGLEPRDVASVGRSRFDLLVESNSEEIVARLKPDFTRLGAIDTRGVMVTSRSSSGERDFVSRFFAPSVGIDEDPVTGSAHCCLGPFWAGRLGRRALVGHQISARGGIVRVQVDGDRVQLSGEAVTVLRGEFAPAV